MIVRELVTLLGFQVEDDKLKKYEQGMAKVTRTIKIAGVAVAGLTGLLLKMGGDAEQTQVSFEVLLKSTEKATEMIENINKMAAVTPYSQKDLRDGAKMMLNFGLAAEEILPSLDMLGNIAMGDANKLSALTLAFSQMSSAGRLNGQDLLQMINAGFNPLQEISRKTGKSLAVLRKEMEKGAISSDMVKDAFRSATSAGGMFYGMMDKQSQSFLGLFSTAKDYIVLLATEIGQDLLPYGKELLKAFSTFMEQNREVIKGGITKFFKGLMYAIGYVVVIIEELIKRLGGMKNILSVVGGGFRIVGKVAGFLFSVLWKLRKVIGFVIATFLVYNAVQKAITAFKTIQYFVQLLGLIRNFSDLVGILNLKMLASPIFWIVAGVLALIVAGYLLVKNWNKVKAFFEKLWAGIKNAFASLFKFIGELLDNPWVQAILAIFAPIIGLPILIIKNWEGIKDFFTKLWTGIVDTFNWAVDKIRGVWGWLTETFDKIAKFLGLKPKKSKGGEVDIPEGKVDIPHYKKGTPYVPEDQLAFLHKGEQILPANTFKNPSNSNTIVINSNPKITVPPGTSNGQADYLKQTAKKVIREEWQSILMQASGANPIPQGG